MSVLELLTHGDGVSRSVAALLLAMSIASWVVILWKAWLLRGGTRDVLRSIAAFWQSATLADAEEKLRAFDRAALVLPAVSAIRGVAAGAPEGTLGAAVDRNQRLTRVLRDALHGALRRLQAGQILLATVGATAPFVGLLGTVWGIYRALSGIAGQTGGFTIDKVAGPVGEALVMTAFGLAVAIPAVLAYNVFGRVIGRVEAELEGFAHDLLGSFGEPPKPAAPPPARPMPV
ncbi:MULTISPECIES: MotA/TolQ/ExbB proton channel family protein [Variovorax]|jgi:biopolymer transport protein ExbB|uniref:MotA/TolQ/ExbB proton channel family protein n=1 Tax=Variovorax TaxID=34072 RepID=UPI00086E82DF|nr:MULTISPECIES: MotA/TolQ/ExbB proton channel family protein [Variovorax]MBN8757500.1 MotA/TolQ/ExbB proton channel family protein [Variovorax sp.]ODU12262.1 MAG: flagellar motor protein MotA [Variovorax sp. SCN 67-85]ODV16642.1 MAG: flagellar motor protein MotA [Variovorax sp. SCN 67-20]OJZ12479.1 MAG: flagellar motor protein MotA [Variovorax sp. 67-131]UKI09208.1 MotA/TolQ/ExbB proton channel family protein [Variovorax paradoxus]